MAKYRPFTHVDLTYKIKNYPSHTPLPHDRIDRAIERAFAKWQAVSPFTFTKTTSESADIVLSFGSVSDPVAHAQTIQGANDLNIVFNDNRTWLDLAEELRAKNITTAVLGGAGMLLPTALVRGIWELVDWRDTNRADVLSIAVHEIGHALGLEHSSADVSVMQPAADYYKMTNVNGAPISQVDIDALKEANRGLFSRYFATHGVTNWFKRGEGFVQVSAGLDNTVWAIDKKGRAREFSPDSGRGDYWLVQGENMLQIAVFSTHMVLAITKDYKLGMYSPPPLGQPPNYDAWPAIAENVRFVATGADGSVWIVNKSGQTFRHRGSIAQPKVDWVEVPAPGFVSLAVGRGPQGKGEQVWATSPNRLFKWDGYGQNWYVVARPRELSLCAAGDDGTIVILSADGLQRYDHRSDWEKLSVPGPMTNISVVSKTNMWGVGQSGELYCTIV